MVCATTLAPTTSVKGLKTPKSGLPCTSYIFPGLLINVMAREELLDSQLVSVILLESQCAAARDEKNIKAHKHSLAGINGLKGYVYSLIKIG